MPDRFQIISFVAESFLLTILNFFILITWLSFFSAIPIILSSIWSIGRIKRDIDKFHNGSKKAYFTHIISVFVSKVKKNE